MQCRLLYLCKSHEESLRAIEINSWEYASLNGFLKCRDVSNEGTGSVIAGLWPEPDK